MLRGECMVVVLHFKIPQPHVVVSQRIVAGVGEHIGELRLRLRLATGLVQVFDKKHARDQVIRLEANGSLEIAVDGIAHA